MKLAAMVLMAVIVLAAVGVLSVVGGAGDHPPRRRSVGAIQGSRPKALAIDPAFDPAAPAAELGDLKPTTLAELLAIAPEDLGRVDLLRMNLLCAEGLPGAERIDIDAFSKRLDAFAAVAKAETERHLYRATDPRFSDHYRHSETYLRCEFLVQTLVERFGMKYNMDRFWNPDFGDSRDQFLHGLMDFEHSGGTCVSIPTLVTAAGRRLGYPLRLVLAREHVFARWDGPGDGGRSMRLNMETSGGGFDCFIDEFYRFGPGKPIGDEDLGHREFLVSLTPGEEFSTFLAARGHCLFDNGERQQALDAYRLAARYAPEFTSYRIFIAIAEATIQGRQEQFLASLDRIPESPRMSFEEASAYFWKP